jgi:hypothetical protein
MSNNNFVTSYQKLEDIVILDPSDLLDEKGNAIYNKQISKYGVFGNYFVNKLIYNYASKDTSYEFIFIVRSNGKKIKLSIRSKCNEVQGISIWLNSDIVINNYITSSIDKKLTLQNAIDLIKPFLVD